MKPAPASTQRLSNGVQSGDGFPAPPRPERRDPQRRSGEWRRRIQRPATPLAVGTAVLTLLAGQTEAQGVPVAACQIVQRDGGAPVAPPMRIYPSFRRDTLFRLSEKYFAEFKFDAVASVVAVERSWRCHVTHGRWENVLFSEQCSTSGKAVWPISISTLSCPEPSSVATKSTSQPLRCLSG